MKQLTESQASCLDLFTAEHWALFQEHCEAQGEDANAITEALGGEPE